MVMAKFHWMGVVISHIFLFIHVGTVKDEQDPRFISYDDLLPTIERFSESGIVSYSQIIFDEPRFQVLVGARDNLLRLSLLGLQKYEASHWPSPPDIVQTCQQKGQSQHDCRNYIKVLLAYDEKILACGTNAFFPKCTTREIGNINTVINEMSGIGRCPYSPHQNVTALLSSNNTYYVGGTVDFSARDPAIYRFHGEIPHLRTVQYNHKWLSEPNFVASYEIGNFTYFMFRETAVEYINCGKIIYSRIARVCKNDEGGYKYLLKDNWTTFLKARLNCSIPGEYPFYYNEIQSVFFLEDSNILYATFTTPSNSILGSAVCAFNMSSIERAFNGPFKYQINPSAAWERHISPHSARRHFQCETPNDKHSLESEKYQLMDEAVQPQTHFPVITARLERFSHIVVDSVSTKHFDSVHVLFIATTEGTIKKMMILPRTLQSCLLEVIQLFPKNHLQPIKVLKILKETKSLYVGTETWVMRIPVERCKRYKTKRACINAMDPYCGWSSHQHACVTAPQQNPMSTFWQQAYPSCPVLNEPVDGEWGPWGEWQECSHLDEKNLKGQCMCRLRHCNSPHPQNGGLSCKGISQEVSNCTRHGHWTEWSAWSDCSESCGLAIKTRRRTCGNPEPAYGGNSCEGDDRDVIYCTSNPPCPAPVTPSVDGHWSDWGHWDECNAICGGGYQMRRRKCDNPLPQHGGRDCIGCSYDYRSCNNNPCPEQRKSTMWTPWLRGNSSKDGFYEIRYRFSCKAHVPDAKFIKVGNLKKEERFCLEDGRNCHPSVIEGWDEWTVWSQCDAEGYQYRRRNCINAEPGSEFCQGSDRQSRMCLDNEERNEINPIPVKSEISTGISVGHLVAGCIVCFIVGAFITGIVVYYFTVRHQRKCLIRGNKHFINRPSSPNLYVPPKDCLPKNNYTGNTLTKNKSIPLTKEATIKRNGHKAQLSPEMFE